MVAKVEFHFGELFPRVGFIVTNLAVRGNGGDARCKRRESKRGTQPKPRPPLIVRDESRVGYSVAGCSRAEPASALPAGIHAALPRIFRTNRVGLTDCTLCTHLTLDDGYTL